MKELFCRSALMAGFGLMLAVRAPAQTFTTLHTFPPSGGPLGGLSVGPCGVACSSNALYGTTYYGGSSDNGTLFAVNADGSGFANLYNFTALSGTNSYGYGIGTNGDGANPAAGVILSGNTLYGTTSGGGSAGNGTVFAVQTDGTGFTNLHSFTGASGDGKAPLSELILSGNTLYGTTSGGYANGGTVFAVNADGTGFTNLHSFTGSDGYAPHAGLVLSGNTLYGTTYEGGNSNRGTVFAINTDGTGFTVLYSFTDGSDGGYPLAGLLLSGTTLYGAAQGGGVGPNNGTLFKLNTDGTDYTVIHAFTAFPLPNEVNGFNEDGSEPDCGLILSGNTLYGTAPASGIYQSGTVFQLNTDGTDFTTLYATFDGRTNGGSPNSRLHLSGKTLFGTTGGGEPGFSTVFSINLTPVSAPQLTMVSSGTNVILSWPTNATGFALESTTSLASPAVWGLVFPMPVVVNGLNTVTNPMSGGQQFYRLSR